MVDESGRWFSEAGEGLWWLLSSAAVVLVVVAVVVD